VAHTDHSRKRLPGEAPRHIRPKLRRQGTRVAVVAAAVKEA
jgi:hypothetical protein